MLDTIQIDRKAKMKKILLASILFTVVLMLSQIITTNLQRETSSTLSNARRALRGGSHSSGGGGHSSSSHSSGGSYHSSGSSYHGTTNNYYHPTTSSSSSSSSTTTHYYSSTPIVYNSGPTYYHNNNNTSYNSGYHRNDGGGADQGIIVLIIFAAIALLICCIFCPGAMFMVCCPCLAGCCCGLAVLEETKYTNAEKTYLESYHDSNGGGGYNTFSSPHSSPYSNNKRNGYDNDARGEFEECARRAKDEVENAPSTLSQQLVPPYSGDYTTSYVDRSTGVQHGAVLHLSFTPDFRGKGYKLSGEGRDIDGDTVIEDGHVNYDGTAWWRERTITKDVGLIVLSRGTFDFSKRTFNGTWLASTMEHGSYIIFEAAVNGAMQQQSPSAPPQDSDDNNDSHIPEATATVVDVQVFDGHDHDIPYVPASVVTPSAPIENKK